MSYICALLLYVRQRHGDADYWYSAVYTAICVHRTFDDNKKKKCKSIFGLDARTKNVILKCIACIIR